MEKVRHAMPGLLLLTAAALLGACGGSPSAKFYTLTPLSSTQAPGSVASRVAVSIEPVELPEYLDRPEIVTREGENEVKVAQFHRWAGSLGENISDLLAEDLGQLLGSDRVLVNNGSFPGKPEYLVAVRVLRLDCLPGDRVLLRTQWRVASGDGKREISRLSSITEKTHDSRFDSTVAAVNRAFHAVSREIAAEIPFTPSAATAGGASP
jgi:uncharacterized protein